MSNKIVETAKEFFGKADIAIMSECNTLPNLYRETAESRGFEFDELEKANSFNRDFINNSAVASLEQAEEFMKNFGEEGDVTSVDVYIPMGEHSNLTHSITAGVPGETEEDTTVGTIVTCYETIHDSDVFDHLAARAEELFAQPEVEDEEEVETEEAE